MGPQVGHVESDRVQPSPLEQSGMREQLRVGLGHPRDHVHEVGSVDRVLVVRRHVHAGKGAAPHEDVEVQVGRSGAGVFEIEECGDLEPVPYQVLEVHVAVDEVSVVPRVERRSGLAGEVRCPLEQQLVDVLVPAELLEGIEQRHHPRRAASVDQLWGRCVADVGGRLRAVDRLQPVGQLVDGRTPTLVGHVGPPAAERMAVGRVVISQSAPDRPPCATTPGYPASGGREAGERCLAPQSLGGVSVDAHREVWRQPGLVGHAGGAFDGDIVTQSGFAQGMTCPHLVERGACGTSNHLVSRSASADGT